MSDAAILNPLLQRQFSVPFDKVRAEHVVPAITDLLARSEEELKQITGEAGLRTYANTLGALESLGEDLEWAMGIVDHLESVMSTDALREAYNEIQPAVSAFYASLSLNPRLWEALKTFAGTEEATTLPATQARLLKKTLASFRRHGADLEPQQKSRLEELEVELAQITTRYSQHVVDATAAFELVVTDEAELNGLPQSARDAAKLSAKNAKVNGWRFTLQQPSITPALTYLEDSAIREKLWRAFTTRASSGDTDNRKLIDRILALRSEKATMLGYADFADLVLEDRMAHDGAQAQDFVLDLEARSRDAFKQESEQLQTFRNAAAPPASPLNPWDVGHFAEKQRRELYDFDEEALRPYFPIESVLSGLFDIVNRLYGIEVRPYAELPVWHPSVKTYAVYEGDTMLGAFYADFFPRDNKRGGAWMNSLITGLPGQPHLGLICGNLSESLEDRPALLTHSEVETIFHEFGHLLHHLLSKVEVRSLAGTNVAWDFVELPSQIMENWCWEREALDLFARHYETGEKIPDPLFQKMKRARTFRSASAMMRQLSFATLDLELHRGFAPGAGTPATERALEIARRFSTTELPNEYAMLCAFTHLFASSVAYAAGYYSYKWAEVLDADAFTAFENTEIFNREVGNRFRRTILERGDSQDPQQLYRDFMGRDPDLLPLLRRSGLDPAGSSQ